MGVELIRACPYCRFPIREKVFESENPAAVSGVYWSDGKEYLPFFSGGSRLLRCQNCGRFYWKNDAAAIGVCDPASDDAEKKPEAWEHVWIRDTVLPLEDCLLALENRIAVNDAQELYIRTLIWWGINDPIRYGKQKNVNREHRDVFLSNATRLRELYELVIVTVTRFAGEGRPVAVRLDSNGRPVVLEHPAHLLETCRLRCAEICRETGAFENGLSLLNEPYDLCGREAAELRTLTEEKKGGVHRFTWSQSGQSGPPREFVNTSGSTARTRAKLEKQKRKAWEDLVDIFKQ